MKRQFIFGISYHEKKLEVFKVISQSRQFYAVIIMDVLLNGISISAVSLRCPLLAAKGWRLID